MVFTAGEQVLLDTISGDERIDDGTTRFWSSARLLR